MTLEFEPTLYDIIEMMLGMEQRLGAQFQLLSGRIDIVDERLTSLEQAVKKVSIGLEDVKDILFGIKDSHELTLKNHEKRLTRLETRTI